MTATEKKPALLVLVGPTAVGKTALSLAMAQQYRAEIISGDSMQVYRGMDIGTAKATIEERERIPHHMIDIHDPDHPFSAAEFQQRTREAIADIHARGKLPFLVGGTGLYVEAVCYEFQFGSGGSDEQYRQAMQQVADEQGEEALHARLAAVDPVSAARIHPNDRRRTIRALEVLHLTGIPFSQHMEQQNKESPYDLLLVGLTMERDLLYARIEQRIDLMMEEGLVEEVERLLAQGYDTDLVSMQGLGYKEIAAYLRGMYSREEAVDLLKRNTRRFAKRQLSWFRHMKDIVWVDVSVPNFSAHLKTIHDILAGKFTSEQE